MCILALFRDDVSGGEEAVEVREGQRRGRVRESKRRQYFLIRAFVHQSGDPIPPLQYHQLYHLSLAASLAESGDALAWLGDLASDAIDAAK